MRSSAAATLKLGCFLYICLPKAVIHMKQGIETEWLKWLLRSSYYLCYCPCIVHDWRALQASPELQFWAHYIKAEGMIPSLQLFDF